MPHLVVSLSGHGFGHVAQTAPVLNRLHALMPQLKITVRSAVPAAHLRSRIRAPFGLLPSEGDLGMAMSSSIDVLADESRALYRHFHADWEARVADEARLLRELGADRVLSNVGYLPLAGAQRAGIANTALCSLNWADIYRHYCAYPVHASTNSTRTEDEAIAEQITACYAQADAFLRVIPGMPMDDLANRITIAPIAAVGENRRGELNHHLKLSREEHLVLVSMGGIAHRLPLEHWPRIEGVRWLVLAGWKAAHPDAIEIESLPFGFSDLLASCDALLCKPGYGSFVEAACSGTPVLYVNRPDWPESPHLTAWLEQHGVCREVSRPQLERGDLAEDLAALWAMPRPLPPQPDGADEAANWLMDRLNP